VVKNREEEDVWKRGTCFGNDPLLISDYKYGAQIIDPTGKNSGSPFETQQPQIYT
jgi:hypothetical protein